MKTLNQMTQELLKNQAGMRLSDPTTLPELTPGETHAALLRERQRRADRLGCHPDVITLSEDTIHRVLHFAREQKLSNLRTTEYWSRLDQPRTFKTLTASELYEAFLTKATAIIRKPYLVDSHNSPYIHKLCLYFSGSPEVENQGLSLSKGILLAGGTGIGKTTIMKALQHNPLQSFTVISSRQISFGFSESGFQLIRHHSQPITIPLNDFGHDRLGTCFDDLGTDEESKHYGEKLNALAEILMLRYENLPFNQTHLTTNLNADNIGQVYGPRLRSRMREMFNLISFPPTSPDRRI